MTSDIKRIGVVKVKKYNRNNDIVGTYLTKGTEDEIIKTNERILEDLPLIVCKLSWCFNGKTFITTRRKKGS